MCVCIHLHDLTCMMCANALHIGVGVVRDLYVFFVWPNCWDLILDDSLIYIDDITYSRSPRYLVLKIFLPTLPWYYLSFWWRNSFAQLMVCCPLYFNQLLVCAILFICHRKKFTSWGVRVTNISRHKNEYLEWS